ncbi:MAG: hypothetical protein NT132_09150 [Microbacterium sp.]|uniref:hypothetical protein n=1 Tax=Microbacterium sp. TaxID=51671 RepID=UPI00262B27EB|nr:hypothetical protein [Microbacterium sp.]MCX6502552.1 hypothetical protein [Microbacterium sp.]
MNYEELADRVATLPGIDRATVPYFVSMAIDEAPASALVTLVREADGTFTATLGDLREKVTVARDAEGVPLRFADESAACEWAWNYVREARSGFRTYTPDEEAAAAASGDEIRRRMAALEQSSSS